MLRLTENTTHPGKHSKLDQHLRREAYSSKRCKNSRANSQYAKYISPSSSLLRGKARYGTYLTG